MPEASFAVEVVSGVPVVATPQEIDISNAAGLRDGLLAASARGDGTLVVDMSGTQFCDSSGINVLVCARERAHSEGGELLLVLTASAVLRVFAITGIDRMIPRFSSLEDALAQALVARSARGSSPQVATEPSPSPSSL